MKLLYGSEINEMEKFVGHSETLVQNLVSEKVGSSFRKSDLQFSSKFVLQICMLNHKAQSKKY